MLAQVSLHAGHRQHLHQDMSQGMRIVRREIVVKVMFNVLVLIQKPCFASCFRPLSSGFRL